GVPRGVRNATEGVPYSQRAGVLLSKSVPISPGALMSTILDRIVASKRQEIAEARARLPDAELERRLSAAPPVRDFRAALEQPGGVQIIAGVKKASRSAGLIRADFDPGAIARTYARHGAACISVLTDAPFFQGHLSYLTAVRAAVAPPVLRKDFLLDR